MTKDRKVIYTLIGIIAGMLIGVALFCRSAGAKMVAEYKGMFIASSYTAASNTPSGSHQTFSGHRAREGVTVAVDDHTPIAKMGQKIVLKWRVKIRKKNGKWKWKWKSHVFRVQDKGHFGHMNNGRRQIDVFFESRGWGLREVKVYVLRPETKRERRQRLRRRRIRIERKRMEKQKGVFHFLYEPTLLPWQIVTDRKIITGGACRIKFGWLDVVSTRKGLGNTVLTGDRSCMFGKNARFSEIREEAKG